MYHRPNGTPMSAGSDSIRRDQAEFARREDGMQTRRPPNKFVAKGHDAQLQAAQYDKSEVVVRMASGDDITGVIARRDKWTITVLEHDVTFPVILYKHAIESIVIKSPAKTEMN